jgi:copper chaperone NosL
MSQKLKPITRWVVILGSLAMIGAYFTSVWYIDLSAPQYPEGLTLEIWVNGLKGDVESINNLNHYIGMKTLHANEFWEFTALPYLLGFMIALGLFVGYKNNRRWLWIYMNILLLIAAVACYDFWRWEYDYGHNLDPHAAIKIPGMAYQPPFLGYKVLLNFIAGSLPDLGGLLIIVPSCLMGALLLWEHFILDRKRIKINQ